MSRSRKPRAATGSRVGGGRLRVDAARAVHKLRDYQLADPAMWALEAVRAAASASSTAVHVDGDADDVWVAWEGTPIAREELTRLFDELVSPQASDDRRALRLLATAINTALGLGPRWVDVYTLGDVGEGAARVRYTPDLLAAGHEGTAEGLRRLAPVDATLPAGAPTITRGVVVHLRRFPALEALSLLATGQESRELRYVRRACEDFPIPLRIARGALARHHADGDLLRVRLDASVLGEDRDGFIAIVDPSAARAEPWIDFAELGVVLATQPLELGIPFQTGARVPVRARIDTARLPTNASRSAVRRDERWIAALEEHLVERFGDLVARVVRELGDAPEGAWDVDRRARLRAAALQLAAAWCGGPEWRRLAGALQAVAMPERLAPLFDAPIARDAIGRARSLRELARAEDVGAHTGAEPLPAELAPWIGDVPWVPPGDALARVWGADPPRSARRTIEVARASREARARWLEKPITPPAITPRAEHVVIAPLTAPGRSARSCVPATLFARPDLAGEVALDPSPARASTITLLVEGRATEISRVAVPVSFDAIATASDLRVAADHTCLVADDARGALLLAIDGARVIACESIARRLAGQDAPKGDPVRWVDPDGGLDEHDAARVVRAGIFVAVELLHRLGTGDASAGATRLLESKSPLLDAPVWPTVTGERVSLADLVALGSDPASAIGSVTSVPHAPWEPEGRRVLVLDLRERDLLATLLPGLAIIDYDGATAPPTAARIARGLRAECVAAIEIEAADHRGAIGLHGGAGAIQLTHAGRTLRDVPLPTGAPRAGWLLAIDDDRVVPGASAPRHVPHAAPYDDIMGHLARLVVAMADALLGCEVPGLHAAPLHPAPDRLLLAAFFEACRGVRPSAANVLGRERMQALRKARLFRGAYSDRLSSLDDLVAALGGELVYVTPVAIAEDRSAPPPDFDPLLATDDVAESIGRFFQVRVTNGIAELERRRRDARRHARIEAHRALPKRALELTRCEPEVRMSGDGLRGMVGLSRVDSARHELRILLEHRAFASRSEGLPHLSAIVDVDLPLVDGELEALNSTGESRVRGALREATCELVGKIATSLDGALAHDEPALALVDAWLAETVAGGKKRAASERAMDALRNASVFETVQGGRASITACTVSRRTLRIAAPIDRWLGAALGEEPDTLDAPILALSGDGALARVVRALAPSVVRDVSADVRRLQATRRVRCGLAERPRLRHVRDTRFRWTLEDLLAVALPSERDAFEVLGIGEIALRGDGSTHVALHEAGVSVTRLDLDLRPSVVIACEPSFPVSPEVAPADRTRLDAAVREVLARAIRHLVETVPHETLPGWVRGALRESALLGGRAHLESLPDLPMFETTAGGWASFRDLQAQVARFAKLWVTHNPGQSLEPLDPERIAIRVPRPDATNLGAVIATQDADPELRLDAIARAHLARPKVEVVGPSAGERARAIAEARIEGHEGVVLALLPTHANVRAMHASRERHPLGTVPDPASWPALSWVDEPRFTPDRTWSAPQPDGVLEEVSAAVLKACEHALESAFPAPERPFAMVRVDRTFSTQALSGRGAQARGVLWIEPAGDATVGVLDAYERSERVLSTSRGPARLPLAGELAIVGVAGVGASAVLTSIANHAYERMTRDIARRLARNERGAEERDLDLAEMVRAGALGFVEQTHPGAAIALPFLDLSYRGAKGDVLGLTRELADRQAALLVPPARIAHARELDWKGPILFEDGSLAATRAILAFGDRVVRFEQALADRVRETPVVRAQPEQLPATGPAPIAPTPAPPPAAAPKRVEPPKPAPRAADPLAERVDATLRRAGAARGSMPRIRALPLSTQPLASLRPDGSVEIARAHPLADALARTGDHPDALAILAAHVIGLAARGTDDAHEAEAHAIHALLTTR
ncbi:hypothetical protein [Sandaracinus amylolyticus]|uniref:Exonuclease SbcC n=1 Tax=Sandaracinus amylolyticus TaxID=927083 RepID=A0A0F6W7T4_9BACT|nr:hypothetical protein [Sandaracinus amylolyticus]AKF09687.1 exonuclease SbcC [Sandaracinus amylolyticus]